MRRYEPVLQYLALLEMLCRGTGVVDVCGIFCKPMPPSNEACCSFGFMKPSKTCPEMIWRRSWLLPPNERWQSCELVQVKRLIVVPIQWYQRLTGWRVSPCRFIPSCSSYAIQAVEIHGAGKGSVLAVSRLCRCHPWGKSGFDPVPNRVTPVS